jgi:hypothetical protein
MVSMVVEDSSSPIPLADLPHFTCFVKHDQISGTPFALAMNGWILDYISGRKENPPYPVFGHEWIPFASQFLDSHFSKDFGKIPVAGKNVGSFDIPFLPELLQRRFMHRTIDPGSVFIDFSQPRPPSLDDIKARFGESEVTHDAREDALDVIGLLRRKY